MTQALPTGKSSFFHDRNCLTLYIRVAAESSDPENIGFAAEPCHLALRIVAMGLLGKAQSTVSINLSPRQLSHSDMPRLLAVALEETGAEPGQLELGITENVLMEHPAVREAATVGA